MEQALFTITLFTINFSFNALQLVSSVLGIIVLTGMYCYALPEIKFSISHHVVVNFFGTVPLLIGLCSSLMPDRLVRAGLCMIGMEIGIFGLLCIYLIKKEKKISSLFKER